MTYKEKAADIYDLLAKGKLLDAFDKYYSEHVVMEELSEEPIKGKQANRQREIDFLESIQDFHGTGVDSITADEENGITAVESWMDVTFKNGTRINMEQVAIQRWENDHIVYEKFYHK